MDIPKHKTFKDLTGQTFGRLTVVAYAGKLKGQHHWGCQCRCGGTKVVYRGSLKNGTSTSCGCVHKEKVTTHGKYKTPEYRAYTQMKRRALRRDECCDRWLRSFEDFLSDVGERPSPHYILRRTNRSVEYGPGNCQWLAPDTP